MLSIFFGYDTEAILSIDKYFNNTYDEEWFDDPYVKFPRKNYLVE